MCRVDTWLGLVLFSRWQQVWLFWHRLVRGVNPMRFRAQGGRWSWNPHPDSTVLSCSKALCALSNTTPELGTAAEPCRSAVVPALPHIPWFSPRLERELESLENSSSATSTKENLAEVVAPTKEEKAENIPSVQKVGTAAPLQDLDGRGRSRAGVGAGCAER